MAQFFADSTAPLSAWANILDAKEKWGSRDLKQSDFGHEKHVKELKVQPVGVEVDLALNEELKYLYVAITRARRRIIVFDDCRDGRRIPFFELLVRRDLGQVATVEDLNMQNRETEWLDEATQSHQWVARGEELLAQGNHEEAAKCFRRGGSQPGELQAMARICQQRASKLKAQRTVDSSEQETDSKVRRLQFEAGYCFVKCGLVKEAYKCFEAAGEQEYVDLLSEAGGAEDVECCICLDRMCDTQLKPCGHVNVCHSCATQNMLTICPFCRAVVESFQNVDTGEETVVAVGPDE